MKKDLKILIIEPSEIITQGLVSILKEQNFNICGIEKNTTRLKSLLEEKIIFYKHLTDDKNVSIFFNKNIIGGKYVRFICIGKLSLL